MANNEDLFKHLNSVPTSGSIIHFFPNSVPLGDIIIGIYFLMKLELFACVPLYLVS